MTLLYCCFVAVYNSYNYYAEAEIEAISEIKIVFNGGVLLTAMKLVCKKKMCVCGRGGGNLGLHEDDDKVL